MTLGLRERKKQETRAAIAEAALELALQRGPDNVTVEEIAAVADVSARTVFNHFGTKDEAILGIDADRRAELVSEVAARPSTEPPLDALAVVLASAVTSDDAAGRYWLARAELVRHHPHLRAAQMASQAALEHDLAVVVAARTGLDVERDRYPALVVTVAMVAMRHALARAVGHGSRWLRKEIDATFADVGEGLRRPLPRTGSR